MDRTQHCDLMPHIPGADDGYVFDVFDIHVFVPFFLCMGSEVPIMVFQK